MHRHLRRLSSAPVATERLGDDGFTAAMALLNRPAGAGSAQAADVG
jgi:hypothetical protein